MKRMTLKIAILLILQLAWWSPAHAETWRLQLDPKGMHTASIQTKNGNLKLICGPENRRVELEISGKPVQGDVAFFSTSRPMYPLETIAFDDGMFIATTSSDIELFSKLVHAFEWTSTVSAQLSESVQAQFNMDGARSFFIECATVEDTGGLSLTEMVELQTNLKTLGDKGGTTINGISIPSYNGSTNGFPNKELSNAVRQFTGEDKAFRIALEKSQNLLGDPEFMRVRAFVSWRQAKLRYQSVIWTKQDYGKGEVTISAKAAGKLSFTCRYADGPSTAKNSLRIAPLNRPTLTPVTVQIDNGAPFHFKMGAMTIDTETESEQFDRLLNELVTGQKVTMTDYRNEPRSILLQGAASVIGPCTSPLYPYHLRTNEEEKLLRSEEMKPVTIELREGTQGPDVNSALRICNTGETPIRVSKIWLKTNRTDLAWIKQENVYTIEEQRCENVSISYTIAGFSFERLSKDNDTWYKPRFDVLNADEGLPFQFKKVCTLVSYNNNRGSVTNYFPQHTKIQNAPTFLPCIDYSVHRSVDVNIKDMKRKLDIIVN